MSIFVCFHLTDNFKQWADLTGHYGLQICVCIFVSTGHIRNSLNGQTNVNDVYHRFDFLSCVTKKIGKYLAKKLICFHSMH